MTLALGIAAIAAWGVLATIAALAADDPRRVPDARTAPPEHPIAIARR